MISFAALSCLQFLYDFLQNDILCSSTYCIVCYCKPAFSVDFFNPIWPSKMPKMTFKMKICVKRKTKQRFVLILSRKWRLWPLFWSSVTSLTIEITVKTVKTEKKKENMINDLIYYQHLNVLVSCVYVYFLYLVSLYPSIFYMGFDCMFVNKS